MMSLKTICVIVVIKRDMYLHPDIKLQYNSLYNVLKCHIFFMQRDSYNEFRIVYHDKIKHCKIACHNSETLKLTLIVPDKVISHKAICPWFTLNLVKYYKQNFIKFYKTHWCDSLFITNSNDDNFVNWLNGNR